MLSISITFFFSCLWISILIFLLYSTTADGLSNPSMSNLALKGIVGKLIPLQYFLLSKWADYLVFTLQLGR